MTCGWLHNGIVPNRHVYLTGVRVRDRTATPWEWATDWLNVIVSSLGPLPWLGFQRKGPTDWGSAQVVLWNPPQAPSSHPYISVHSPTFVIISIRRYICHFIRYRYPHSQRLVTYWSPLIFAFSFGDCFLCESFNLALELVNIFVSHPTFYQMSDLIGGRNLLMT